MINRNISLELPREATSFTHDDGNQHDDEIDKDVYEDNEEVNLILSGVLAHGPHHLKQLPGRY